MGGYEFFTRAAYACDAVVISGDEGSVRSNGSNAVNTTGSSGGGCSVFEIDFEVRFLYISMHI